MLCTLYLEQDQHKHCVNQTVNNCLNCYFCYHLYSPLTIYLIYLRHSCISRSGLTPSTKDRYLIASSASWDGLNRPSFVRCVLSHTQSSKVSSIRILFSFLNESRNHLIACSSVSLPFACNNGTSCAWLFRSCSHIRASTYASLDSKK